MMISFPSPATDDEADPDYSSSGPAETHADDEGTASAHNGEGTDAIGFGMFACGLPVDDAQDPRNVTDTLAVFASAPALDMSSKRGFPQRQVSQVRCLFCCRTVAATLLFYTPSIDLSHPLRCCRAWKQMPHHTVVSVKLYQDVFGGGAQSWDGCNMASCAFRARCHFSLRAPPKNR